jgi:tryptophan-rich antigen (Pv-fam-a)
MISKYKALQEQIDNQPALGQQKLKAMLRFLQDGQVSQSELEKILTSDYKGKTEEQSELYTTLVGLVIDLYIKNNGQESFLELYNSLQEEPEQVQDESVKEGEEQSEPTEGSSTIVAPQHTERTPQAVAPRKRMRLASPKPKEEVQEPVVEPVEPVEEVLPIEEVAEVEEVKEQPVATEPIEPEVQDEPELEEEIEVVEIETPEESEGTEVEEPEEPVAEDDSEPVADAKPRKKGGVLKYIAVGVPTVLAIGGLVFWQVNENNKASSLAEQEVVKILEEAPKKEDTATALSSGEFDNNVKALTTAFDTIKQNDKTGLSGYFTFEDKRYIIQKYDQSGTLTVFDPKGEKVVYNDEWVQKFIENSKAKAKKTEKKEEKPKSSDDSSKKENKKDADSNAVQTKKREGSN